MVEHAQHGPLVRALLLLALLGAAPARAECRLALLLGIDVSSSVDPAEDRLQRSGLAAALLSPRVRAAFLATPEQPVALSVFEWSGRYQQDTLLEWSLINSDAALLRAAERIQHSKRSYTAFPTAMGYAIGHAASLFRTGPNCPFKTLDISGDGINNEGFTPKIAYKAFPLQGVVVNGLPIGGAPEQAKVFAFYQNEVIRGPGAFIEIANDFKDFERAMRRKLERELAPRMIGQLGPLRQQEG